MCIVRKGQQRVAQGVGGAISTSYSHVLHYSAQAEFIYIPVQTSDIAPLFYVDFIKCSIALISEETYPLFS